jgi:hypothetical protein
MKYLFLLTSLIFFAGCLFESRPEVFCDNGTIIWESTYEYDSMDRLLTFKIKFKGSDSNLVFYSYKENGEVVIKEFHNNELISENCTNISWDSARTLQYMLTCSSNPSIIRKLIFDSKGRLVDSYEHKEDSIFLLKSHNEYIDSLGTAKYYLVDTTGLKMLSQEIIYGTDGKPKEEIRYTSYSDNTPISKSKYVYKEGYIDVEVYENNKLKNVTRMYATDEGIASLIRSCNVN